jgi:hypothetical protein
VSPNRISMPRRPRQVPGRETHMHACGHGCDCYLGAFASTTDCRKCRTARFNQQALEDLR